MLLLATAGLLVTHDAPAQQSWVMTWIVPAAVFFGVMYFVAIRPQQQERQAHDSMVAGLAKGDRVVISSGIHGKVAEVQGDTLVVEIAEKTRVTVDKSAVTRKLVESVKA